MTTDTDSQDRDVPPLMCNTCGKKKQAYLLNKSIRTTVKDEFKYLVRCSDSKCSEPHFFLESNDEA